MLTSQPRCVSEPEVVCVVKTGCSDGQPSTAARPYRRWWPNGRPTAVVPWQQAQICTGPAHGSTQSMPRILLPRRVSWRRSNRPAKPRGRQPTSSRNTRSTRDGRRPVSSVVAADIGSISALYRHRRRHVHCAGMDVPVLKMIASESTATPMPAQWTCRRRCRDRADIEPIQAHMTAHGMGGGRPVSRVVAAEAAAEDPDHYGSVARTNWPPDVELQPM